MLHRSSIVVLPFERNVTMDNPFNPFVNQTATQDEQIGPTLRGHDVQFDFTLLFERVTLSILPSALFLVYAPLRAWWLWGEQRKAKSGRWILGKQVRGPLYN